MTNREGSGKRAFGEGRPGFCVGDCRQPAGIGRVAGSGKREGGEGKN